MAASTSSITRPDFLVKSWQDRVNSSYPVTVAYTYEIVVPHSNSLGLSLKTSSVSYNVGSKNMAQYISVLDAKEPLNMILYTGDIILKVNNVSLISTPENAITYEAAVKAITTAEVPRHIKILRLPVINNANTLPSPLELSLFASDPNNVSLRFTGVKVDSISEENALQQPAADSSTIPSQQQTGYIESAGRGSCGWGYDYTLTILDPNHNGPNFPQVITKMARKAKISWDTNPGSLLVSDCITAPSNNANFAGRGLEREDSFLAQEEGCLLRGTACMGAGIYKDKSNRYVAVMHVDSTLKADERGNLHLSSESNLCDIAQSSSGTSKKRKVVLLGENVQSYYVGRYDSEIEAAAAYKFAWSHYCLTGMVLSHDYVQKTYKETN